MLTGNGLRSRLYGIVTFLQQIVYYQVGHLTWGRKVVSWLMLVNTPHHSIHELVCRHFFRNEFADDLRVFHVFNIAREYILLLVYVKCSRLCRTVLLFHQFLELLLFPLVELLLKF